MISNHNRKEGIDTENKEENTQIPVIWLGRQLRYERSILKIYKDRVPANDREARWDFIHHDGAAAALPVADDGKILMVCQYRNTLDHYTLEIPAGKLDKPGEPKVGHAFRGLGEGARYGVESSENLEYPMNLTTTAAFYDEAIDIFTAHNLIPFHQHLDEDEVVNMIPCSLEELENMVYTGKIADGKTIVAIMAYTRKYRSEDKKDSMVRD